MKTYTTICRTLLRNNHRLLRPLPTLSHSLSTASSTTTTTLPRRFFHSSPRNVLPNFPHQFSSKRFLSEAASSEEDDDSEAVVDRKCWNCSASQTSMSFVVCDSCGFVQPADESIDYYQLYDLEQKFSIDEGGLEAKYKDWQKKLHPDVFKSKSEKEREYAAEQSSRLTEAYKMLKDPLSRALYIIKLHGLPPQTDDAEDEALKIPADESPEMRELRRKVAEKLGCTSMLEMMDKTSASK